MSPEATHTIEILNIAMTKVCQILTPFPLDSAGTIIQYSKELSDYGTAKFRISAYDTLFAQFGNFIQPHAFHVRIRRQGIIVWQGAIIEVTANNKEYVEVLAAEYLWYLEKKLVHRSSVDPITGTSDGIYRIFQSGTMAAAVTAIMTESIADWANYPTQVIENGQQQNITVQAAGHILAQMTLGEIDNPNYPPNVTDGNGNAISGAWNFVTLGTATGGFTLQYDFTSILYILKAFAAYTYADFQIVYSAATRGLVFNFLDFLGNNRQYQVNFTFGDRGNILNYNVPQYGQRMVNAIVGVATDDNGVILFYDQSDQDSIANYGLIEGVAAFSDIKSQSVLNARIQAELPLVSTPDDTAMSITLNEKTNYPLGQFDIGDIVNINIQNKSIDFDEPRRIVGISVSVNNTGRETTVVQTNKPLPWQFGIANT
jgi:hypothetical protein